MNVCCSVKCDVEIWFGVLVRCSILKLASSLVWFELLCWSMFWCAMECFCIGWWSDLIYVVAVRGACMLLVVCSKVMVL